MMTDTALTDEETDDFESVVALLTAYSLRELPDEMKVALLRVKYEGRDEAAIVVVDERVDPDSPGDIDVRPIALLISDEIFARMEQPS